MWRWRGCLSNSTKKCGSWLCEEISVFTSLKDREGGGLREYTPPPPTRKLQASCSSPHSDSTSLSCSSSSSSSSSPCHHLSFTLAEWSRVMRMGKHLPRRKHTCSHALWQHTHSLTEFLSDAEWSEPHMLHKTNLDGNFLPTGGKILLFLNFYGTRFNFLYHACYLEK